VKLAAVPNASARPTGYRTLGYAEGPETERAALFEYHGVSVWIPKKALVFAEGRFHAPLWAIASSKQYQQDNEKPR
jgi:hypothetical protein